MAKVIAAEVATVVATKMAAEMTIAGMTQNMSGDKAERSA